MVRRRTLYWEFAIIAVAFWLLQAGAAFSQLAEPYPAAQVRKILPDKYVVADAGRLMYAGERLRLWGYNLQSGVFPDYESIRLLAQRLQQLGVTGIRLWPSPAGFYDPASAAARAMTQSRQGDNSRVDRYDFLVAQLKERGIFIQNTALYYLNAETIAAWDPRLRELLGPDLSVGRIRDTSRIAPYISDLYVSMLETHMGNYLTHVNPYTGKRYADEEVFSGWELINESPFVPCMLARDCLAKLPEGLKTVWSALWQQFSTRKGGAGGDLPVFDADWNTGDSVRHRDYREFVVDRFVQVSRRMQAAARSHGRPGTGITVQPFTFNTQSGAPLAAAHAANAAGDMVAISAYQSPLSRERSEFFPWRPLVSNQAVLYNFNFGAVDGKPTIVYETSFFRPYPYRVEWAGVMLGLGALQDWDAVYLYMYGQPRIIYSGNGGPAGYGTQPLPEPGGSALKQPRDYTFGFHHGGDPAIVSAWMAAAPGFGAHGVILCSEPRKLFAFKQNQIFGLPPGYCSAREGCAARGETLVGAMNQASLQQPIRLAFGIGARRASAGGSSERAARCTAGTASRGSVTWKPNNSKVVIQSPGYFAVFGKIEAGDGLPGILSVVPERAFFGAIALYSADAKPIAQSQNLRVHIIGDVANSGFELDTTAVRFESPLGAIAGVRNPGSTPLEYKLPGVKVTLGPGRAELTRFDFTLNSYARETVNGTFAILPAEKFFVGRILRARRE